MIHCEMAATTAAATERIDVRVPLAHCPASSSSSSRVLEPNDGVVRVPSYLTTAAAAALAAVLLVTVFC